MSAPLKWSPGDDELDAMARTLTVAERDAARTEEERTSLLARAGATTQQRRSSRTPVIAATAAVLAAAAAIVLWIRPTGDVGPKETITAVGPATFERLARWPDFVVRVDAGMVSVRVAKLDDGERFRVKTVDAEIEVRGTRFLVGTEHGRLSLVAVSEGRVEVRWAQQAPVFLAAGQSWSPVRTVRADVISPTTGANAQSEPAHQGSATSIASSSVTTVHDVAAVSGGPGVTTRHDHGSTGTPKQVSSASSASDSTAKSTTASAQTPSAPRESTPRPSTAQTAPTARPGEADFRAGVAALRAGDAAVATRSFAVACSAAKGVALGEDACAAKRAGQTSVAREALQRFVERYPSSARAGEASALLGWILYEAGDLDGAQRMFDRAANDAVPKVRESAERGREAIKRKRGVPQP